MVNPEPFGHPIIGDIIRTQWCGKGKADIQAYMAMVAQKKIPEAVILAVVTAVRVYVTSHDVYNWITFTLG